LDKTITRIKVPLWSRLWAYLRFQRNLQNQLRNAEQGKMVSERVKQTIDDVRNRKKAMHDGPLSEEWIRKITESQNKNLGNAEQRSLSMIKEDPTQKPVRRLHFQHKGVILLESLLKKYESEIKSVVNIGASVDLVSAYLASKYPSITFTSVEFQTNLKERNSFLPQSKNWNFVSGYALDLLRKGKIQADVYLTTSTSVRFNNKELDMYIDEYAKYAKFVGFNEGWWFQYGTKNPFHIIKPEDIPEDNSFIAGKYGDYHHNYIKKLKNKGFEILSSEILDGSHVFTLQILAKNKNLTNF